ncbi:MAG: DUF2971 domain-containing protein [Fulvivirga sp.]
MPFISKEDSREFEGEKTLYHYTSIYTSIEKIFPSNKLRLSPLISASDPMELTLPSPWVSSSGYEEDFKRLNEKIAGGDIATKINTYYKSLRQLCLCRNSDIEVKGLHTGVFEPLDHFGFAKPRMWDQYGDRFKGVCIALSRSKLEEKLSSSYRLFNVEYHSNHLFKPNIDSSSIDLNEIERIGEIEYLRSKYESEILKISSKHTDYRDENECKVITSTEHDYSYLDISNCIQGIFFTNKLNYAYESILKNIAKRYEVPLLQIHISRRGISVRCFA